MRPIEVFPISVLSFCSEWFGWGVKWHTMLAIVSLSIFCLLEIDLLSSSLFRLVKAGQTDVVGPFSFANPDWDLGPTNWILRPQMNLNPQSSDSQADTLWALRTFRFLFRYSQWIGWSVNWPSMLSVVSLLPSFALWVMIVSWLLCFRLEAPFGSSNFLDMNAHARTTEGLETQICGIESGGAER